jgi:hypothetical protein
VVALGSVVVGVVEVGVVVVGDVVVPVDVVSDGSDVLSVVSPTVGSVPDPALS